MRLRDGGISSKTKQSLAKVFGYLQLTIYMMQESDDVEDMTIDWSLISNRIIKQ